ncbi:Hypothetical protein HDN1F_31840 [gamma proteobacterium HdN1]|nr:Hypothetical protein HDN1F_31840 [gamma proteobacterium HdN1]
MGTPIALVIATAILSSLFTLGFGYVVLYRYLRREFEAGLREAIKRINAEVGPEIEVRVKKGVQDAVRTLASRETLRETTRSMARTGAELVNEGIKPFLKIRRPRHDNDMLDSDDGFP